jgi:hypothetical protein
VVSLYESIVFTWAKISDPIKQIKKEVLEMCGVPDDLTASI